MRKHGVGVAFAIRGCLHHWSFFVVKKGPEGGSGKLFSGIREIYEKIFSHTSSVDKLIDDMASRIYVSGESSSVIRIKELLRLVQS